MRNARTGRLITILAGLAAMAAAPAPPLDRIIASARFDGVVIAGDSDRPASVHGDASAMWRWASVSKQLAATIVMQEVEAGRLSLDRPITDWWPEWPQIYSDLITIRDLLQHTSGLADPNEDGPNAPGGMPLFYRPPPARGSMIYEATHYCAEHPRAKPGLVYHYDNCDFIVLGALLERTTGKPYAQLLQERIAAPLGLKLGLFSPDRPPAQHVRGVAGPGAPEDIGNLGTYGAAGSVYGAPLALYAFDRALLEHRLLGEAATAEMWRGEPKWGAAALGQWQYETRLAGCPAPVSVVERRGQIGGVQVRNFILPAMGKALVMFTRRGDFPFGEVWRNAGFAYRALSAVGCAT
ncbi:MAG TPA: serine hydrolase domain-containing protein [Sphingomonas sp.]